jgi:signal transduction histidine kinase
VLLLVYSVGRHTSGRRLLAGAVVVTAVLVELVVGAHLPPGPGELVYLLILLGGALGLGISLRVQTERAIALALAVDRAREEQAETARAAARAERSRIARELHEIVAHDVQSIVLEADRARSALDGDPTRAMPAIRAVEDAGRQALSEMRRLVGILREDEIDGWRRPPASDPLPELSKAQARTVLGWLARERRVRGRSAPSVFDWLVATGLVALALLEIAAGAFPVPTPIATVAAVAAILPVAFRRVAPLAAIAASTLLSLLALAGSAWVGGDGSVASGGMMLILTYSVGRSTRGPAFLLGSVCALVMAVGSALARGSGPGEIAMNLAIVGGILVLGVAVRVQTTRAGAYAVAAEHARREQAEAAQAAVRGERGRIARELHDVVAHDVGLIVLQAGGARSVLASDGSRARAALEQVDAIARRTDEEIHRALGILNVDSGASQLQVPDIDGLPALVDEAHASGLEVDLQVVGRATRLPAGLGLAVYRLVEEALTNVRKHAPAAHAEVHLHYRPDSLRVDVRDDGGPPGSAGAPTPQAGAPGYGLVGMRERVALYGGRMEAGPTPLGGFLVTAELPLIPESA